MRSVQRNDISQLDRFLAELGKDELGHDELGKEADKDPPANENDHPRQLLREHLESARVYLLGLMPAEYALSLRMAEESLNSVSDPKLRKRIQDFIQGKT